MPNSANRSGSGNNGSKGHPKHEPSRGSSQKPNPERSDVKHGDDNNGHKGSSGRSSNQGRKEASGGDGDE